MLQFRSGAGGVVAADTQNAVSAADDALLNGVRMYASMIEATKGSNLPAAQSQKLFRSVNASLNQFLAGRADLVSAVQMLTVIKGQSNFAPESYGCPAGWVAHEATPVTAHEPTPVAA
ncbi:hypothetical protein [Sphingomonas sp. 37zxx]|uniref:hypothetical protein n=1 Tax=Sphingomonas sp. 37zxx TaxID=1550073 RepID=UPI00053C01D3|nr:hypothetical protein [Sphingomonas sp. 37zxx]